MKNARKRDLVTLVVGGIAALILSKIEKAANKKADELFPDEPQQKN